MAVTLEQAKDFVEILAIVIGGPWALYQFQRSVQDRRAEWLWRMSNEFYSNAKFAQVRNKLESTGNAWVSDPGLDDFLNFLETVAVLHRLGQYERKHIAALFGYWTELLLRKEGARAYLKANHYAHLLAWVEKRPYLPPMGM